MSIGVDDDRATRPHRDLLKHLFRDRIQTHQTAQPMRKTVMPVLDSRPLILPIAPAMVELGVCFKWSSLDWSREHATTRILFIGNSSESQRLPGMFTHIASCRKPPRRLEN